MLEQTFTVTGLQFIVYTVLTVGIGAFFGTVTLMISVTRQIENELNRD